MNSRRQLRWILGASAVYDLLAVVLLLAMPGWLFELFSHPLPHDAFLFRLAALPLWMGAAVYAMAAQSPSLSLVRACVVLRVWGATGIALLLVWQRPLGLGAYLAFVAGDLLWAALIVLRRHAAIGES